ncbi:dehydrodolichyl diphosphate synthase CPT3-like [Benincasa hispida]|uniref:dehydrodolichyl diphosphate synthase CPT3-like n=1 Tax=Benincasa hispida TaxID=102211 RepID=UPI001900CFA9|nr:dehydrodolichyl diphosphate synthase CPT3-like [Benincasa hispida]XP_038878035.1 dehydrodolichyl diphosphate synthase CPT3-like [Benincasa hispida]XP_038878036.1 dehydrodolichyl diphosphate synthase CPT3-like [Benincasa hispida]
MRVGNVCTNIWVILNQIFERVISLFRRCTFVVLSMGSIPVHVAFIMDGNRRFAKKRKLAEGAGHRIGYLALTFMLKYCYELGVKYVTVYAFSIDNFRRSPEEVQSVMDLMLEKVELLIREESLVNQYGVRLHFLGNLNLLSEPVRKAVQRAMEATRNNNRADLAICVAYTSTDEIVHAVERSCEEKWNEMNSKSASGVGYGLSKLGVAKNGENSITLADVEKHMYTGVAPDPDMLIRTSGEARLSNFLLWQTSLCYLYSPSVLWPEINFWHFLWAMLNFQRNNHHLVKKRKQL